MKSGSKWWWIASAVWTLSSVGCGEEAPGTGGVEVSWMVEGATCQIAGLETVRAELHIKGEVVSSEEAACLDGKLRIDDVLEGRYDIYLAGLDAAGHVRYDGSHTGLKVKAGSTYASPPAKIRLTMKLAELRLQWSLQATNPMCGFNNVSVVEVNVFQAGSMFSLYQEDFPCDPGTVKVSELPSPLVEGWIIISQLLPGDVTVVLYGLDSKEERIFKGESSVTLTNVEPVDAQIPLTPCDNGCI
jgi:hypothetical protein